MKKIIAFIAVIGIVFSSCNGKYTIAKRKYNKGFYVSTGKGSNTKPAVAHTQTTKAIVAEEKVETVVVAKTTEAPVDIAPLKTTMTPEANNTVKTGKTAKQAPAIASTSKNDYTTTKEISPLKIDHSNAAAKKGGSGNIVLMVILCFLWFLNLIAVYMHDDGITLNFWITLLLDFTLIGGIIFSLLVVLDVVDLS